MTPALFKATRVAPFTGAWIEIRLNWFRMMGRQVAPFTGAWIEMAVNSCVW